MGWITGTQCYSTAAAAAASVCAQQTSMGPNGPAFCAGVDSSSEVAGTAALAYRFADGSGGFSVQSYELQFQACNENEQYEDLSAAFVLLLGALTVLWAVKQFWLKLVTPQ